MERGAVKLVAAPTAKIKPVSCFEFSEMARSCFSSLMSRYLHPSITVVVEFEKNPVVYQSLLSACGEEEEEAAEEEES